MNTLKPLNNTYLNKPIPFHPKLHLNKNTHIKATVSNDNEFFNLEIQDLNALEKWDSIRKFLLNRGGIRSITKGNIKRLVQNENYTCIDVRDKIQFNRGPRIEGAINIPLFT